MSNPQHFYKFISFNIFSSEWHYSYTGGCHLTTKDTAKVKEWQIWLMSLMSKMNSSLVTYFRIAVSWYEISGLTFRISECAFYLVVKHLQRHNQWRKQLPAHLNITNEKTTDEIWKVSPQLLLGKKKVNSLFEEILHMNWSRN